jgi:hypothetical protein
MGTNERRLAMLEKRARDLVTTKAVREAKRAQANSEQATTPHVRIVLAFNGPWRCGAQEFFADKLDRFRLSDRRHVRGRCRSDFGRLAVLILKG